MAARWKRETRKARGPAVAALAGALLAAGTASADEQVFGFTRGAETLPADRNEVFQFITYRTGKSDGSYNAFDFETELEHGFTDRLQASLSIVQHHVDNHGVDGDRDALDDLDAYRFGGLEGSVKYRIWTPFNDPVGVALRLEGGYLWNDEVGGLKQHESYVAPELDLQKDFRDDTIIVDLDLGAEWAWGKQPAEEYPRELSLQAASGVSWRFAPNWFVGGEGAVRSEFPMFDFDNFEHYVVYAGPSLHHSAKRWWATLTWVSQVWGEGVDEPSDGKTFAEETKHKIRVKIGFNF